MNQPITVSALNTQIKSLLETTFIGVYVEGEISNLTYHSSGHIYFSIKDQKSTISCVMFRGNAQYLKFRLEVGMKIVISGSITVYTPRGNYQLMCNKIDPAGQGALALAYEQLKQKLQAKGYFDQNLKKALPKYPKHIVLVTSPTGAAIEDMKKVATHRWPMTKFTLISTLVQGEGAKEDIVDSIKRADAVDADLIIVGRGGGSIEDLWAFNEECVADAIFYAQTPIISAVGHEVDFLISDFVADVRAATPSNAIEIALPDMNEHRIYLDNMKNDLDHKQRVIFNQKTERLVHLRKMFEQHSFANRFEVQQQQLNLLKQRLSLELGNQLKKQEQKLALLKNEFVVNDPKKKSLNGYAQVVKNNKITPLENLKVGDDVTLQTVDVSVSCYINNVTKID